MYIAIECLETTMSSGDSLLLLVCASARSASQASRLVLTPARLTCHVLTHNTHATTQHTMHSQAHAAYKKTFAVEFERASADIAALKRILHDADAQRLQATKRIDTEFQKIEDAVELSLQTLRHKLESAASDTTFASTFKLQLERLL